MEFDAIIFDEDIRDALTLLEAHGIYPAQLFVRQTTLDAIKIDLSSRGFTKDELQNSMYIEGIPCIAWSETTH
ncbi:MAG: hypothetical protein QFB87_05085 [Patescibacteria group bacterium]|nr:hypothetical protein [Patescibacteria group bacterium]